MDSIKNSCIGNSRVSESEKVRSSNIELYRIIVMLLIIAHHFVVNSQIINPTFEHFWSWRSVFLQLFGAWGKIGINCFVIISGYFMCTSRVTVKKFVKLLGEVMFYRITIQSIFWIAGYSEFSLKAFIKLLFPVMSVEKGFTDAYLVFYLCIPFLNILLKNLCEKMHILLLLFCSFTYVFFGTIKIFPLEMNYVSWFIVLYFFGAYIRMYPKPFFENKNLWGWISTVFVTLCAVSVVLGSWIHTKIPYLLTYYFVTDSNTILALMTGISTFLFFKNIKLRYNKWINMIAATAFGILNIHANCDDMRSWLWEDVLQTVNMYNSCWLPLLAVASVIAVFIVCSIIDLVRIQYIEKPFFRLWDVYWEPIKKKFLFVEDKLCKQFNIQK